MKNETKSVSSVFVVLAGYVLSATAFTLGGSIGNGLNFTNGLIATLLGNLILALYAGLMGYLCYKTGKNAGETYKPVFGKKGSILAVSIAGLFVVLFTAVYCALVGSMTSVVFPEAPMAVGIIALFVFIIVTTAVNLTGFKGLSYFGKFAIPAIALFVVYGLVMIQRNVGFSSVMAAQPTAPMSLFSGISLVAASWMTGATVSSDMTRFVKKPAYIFVVTIAAFLSVAILESVGMFLSLASGQSNMVTALSAMGMGGVAYALYLLLTLSSGAPSVMIVCNSILNILNIFPKQAEKVAAGKITARTFLIPIAIFAAAGGLYLMLSNFTTSFIGMINIIGSAIPPIGGVVAGHYLFVQRDYEKAFENVPDFNIPAFVAWIAGICVSVFLKWGIVALNGFVVAGVVYVVLSLVSDKGKAANA